MNRRPDVGGPAPTVPPVPPDASKTREKLVDAAARAFAEDGVFSASLVDITRKAGQRNKGALHYHFGSREAIVCAVLERHVDLRRLWRDSEPALEATRGSDVTRD